MGTAVDIDIAPRAHALLSASSAERWLTCTPSARIEEALPEEESGFASEGTAAHAFAEIRLRFLLEQITKDEYREGYAALKLLHADSIADWEATEWDAINSYVDYVMGEVARLGGDVYIEARVDYSKYAESGFGTSDVLIVSRDKGTIKSIDLKFGKGVPVSAVKNVQAMLYALGGYLGFGDSVAFDTVEWAIVQPRLDYVGEDDLTVPQLLKWAEEVVAPAARLAWEGKGELKPSPKACRFCKASATCRARVAENVLIARRDFMPTPDPRLEERLMTMEEVARILPDIDGWIQWANQLKEYALKQVRDHQAVVPGYKLVRGRANRQWSKEDEQIAEALKAAGVSETSIYPPATKVRSVAQMEKELGKAKFREVAEPLVTIPLGTPALVPDTDPRPPINAAAEAVAAFAATEAK